MVSDTQKTTISLLKILNVKVHRKRIIKELYEHPQFPSLLSISDCLLKWNVKNQTYYINPRDYDPKDLKYPFIAHSKAKGGEFFLVHSIIGEQVLVSTNKIGKQNISELEFLKIWDGILLYAEPDEQSGSKEFYLDKLYYTLLFFRPYSLILLSFSLIYFLADFSQTNSAILVLILLKSIGLIACLLMLASSFGKQLSVTKQICSLGKSDCESILGSKASKINEWLTWSEVGLIYFSGGLLALLISPINQYILHTLSFLCIPFTFYSFVYQYNERKWCVLCCAVQIIFYLESLTIALKVNLPPIQNLLQQSLSSYLALFLCFLFPITFWSYIKRHIIIYKDLKATKNQLKKFKFNDTIFDLVMSAQKEYNIPNDVKPFVMGNPSAENVVTIVSNPYCLPCANAHMILEEWIKTQPNLKVNIIFTTEKNINDNGYKFSKYIAALSEEISSSDLELALNQWYKTQNLDIWTKQYPLSRTVDTSIRIDNFNYWCDEVGIYTTPTILINKKLIPDPYSLEDLKYLIR